MTRWLDLLRLRSLLRSADVERDLDRELRAHLAAAVDEKVAAGMAPEQARRDALREFGSVAAVAEACRDTRRVSWVQNPVRDLRHACRSLLAQPVLVVAAIVSIAVTLFFGDWSGNDLRLSGRAEPVHAEYVRSFVGSGYFEVLGIDLVAGRSFTSADRPGGPGSSW